VTLKGDNVNAVEAMLEFMYTFDYDSSGRAENSSSPMIFNVKVYHIADKYMVPALKSLAQRKFQETIGTCWDMDDFPDAIAQVYGLHDTSDQGLHKMVIDVVRKHREQLILKPRFCDILEGTVGFASDFAKCLIAKGDLGLVKYRCEYCGKTFEAIMSEGNCTYCVSCAQARLVKCL
jgi:speckle-type POZ protein